MPRVWRRSRAAFIFYEYATTFAQEVECIWKRKFSGVTVICVLARYLSLADRVARLLQWVIVIRGESLADKFLRVTPGVQSVNGYRLGAHSSTVPSIGHVVFSALRVYAIWGANRTLALIVFFLAMGAPCVTAYYNTFLTTAHAPGPLTGCRQHFNGSKEIEQRLCKLKYAPLQRSSLTSGQAIVESCFAVVAEVVVLVSIWLRTGSIRMAARRNQCLCLARVVVRAQQGKIDSDQVMMFELDVDRHTPHRTEPRKHGSLLRACGNRMLFAIHVEPPYGASGRRRGPHLLWCGFPSKFLFPHRVH
ncbi:hypothetical protein NM688_g8790 [Phlebia brevispora]|uniref:Uncharacterized protein n=1 Tax=Phlebia brevispora TaxID=194682 RepID=A0ACC1RP73_9APHY|nr:hypothetical protein NM688_g8790 [Phlebia brevispora]